MNLLKSVLLLSFFASTAFASGIGFNTGFDAKVEIKNGELEGKTIITTPQFTYSGLEGHDVGLYDFISLEALRAGRLEMLYYICVDGSIQGFKILSQSVFVNSQDTLVHHGTVFATGQAGRNLHEQVFAWLKAEGPAFTDSVSEVACTRSFVESHNHLRPSLWTAPFYVQTPELTMKVERSMKGLFKKKEQIRIDFKSR